MPTAVLYIYDKNKNPIRCRAIIDTGSTKHFIVEELATRLQLPKTEHHVSIGALNDLSTVSKYGITTSIASCYNGYQKTLEFLSVPCITSLTPENYINRSNIELPKNIQLADPEFHKPASIQLLIGAGTALSLLCVGQIKLSNPKQPDLILQKTHLGWIIGGTWPSHLQKRNGANCFLLNPINDISRFWEIDEDVSEPSLSSEEAACEQHFKDNVSRNPDGRYMVALPFNNLREQLGESFNMAFKRLQSLQRKFKNNNDLKIQYTKNIKEYIDLGYMTKLKGRPQEGFYLPHQAVIKESSATTKTRVVFDASAKTSSGISLNDALLAGPVVQDNIFALLIRFRTHKWVLTGDLEKMYLQILVRRADRKYLLILWIEEDGSLSVYECNRLLFGLKPSSFISTRCLKQLAEDEREEFPKAAAVFEEDLYVDDLLTGDDSIEKLIELRKELTTLSQRGGFNLRQCASNSHEVLQTIPNQNVNLHLQTNDNVTLKTLGVHWNSTDDAFIYTVIPSDNTRMTKRTIFSQVAKIFDPLGLLNPVVVVAKLLIQELWKLKLDWDESLPADIHTRYCAFINQLPELNDFPFPRHVLCSDTETVELHGFCDASERAYGACIYFRSIDKSGKIYVNLACAKSRVAPISSVQTIPRLELCAAVLLANLYNTVQSSVRCTIGRAIFWTDSMIALHWIKKEPHTLKPFVARRVSEIIEKTDSKNWRHVRTHDNPADIISRGISATDFKKNHLWINGPPWLSEEEEEWPIQHWAPITDLPDVRKTKCLATICTKNPMLERFSSFTEFQRFVAYCLRIKLPKSLKPKGGLRLEEIRNATIRILSLLQAIEFKDELKQLKKDGSVSIKSRLANLNPFISEDGLIHVGGRLKNSSLNFTQKHPIILPKSHHITKTIILQEHLINLHAGTQTTLYAVRKKYWPLDGRNQVRHVIRKCLTCLRTRPPPVDYTMGQLPEVRTMQCRPFTNTGVDYCGPFFIKEKRYRNQNKIKVYVAVFICLATKAVHMEVAEDMTTQEFLATLNRFISRRGICSAIYSDNGTNFVGAKNELNELYDLISSAKHNDKVQIHLRNKGIVWHFNPPASPHFGGIWEAAVKSFKHHLKRVIGETLLTYSQFNTLAIEIEAILNSRPLTPLSSDPNDPSVLTPSHFLIGDNMSGLPEHDFTGVPENRLSTWQHIQKMKQDFWKRWHKEYVNELNIRRKWVQGDHPIKLGSVVLIRDDNIPNLQWRLGRVVEICPGKDGIIRVVKLRTANGEVTRNVKRLVPLPTDSE